MIQEKDFLYRVPVKNVLVTTPRQQVRNPEILVDLEGGEFMHGNILDANSTNKLINQSVKDAVDNKLIESGYVTQDLLDAETTRATEQENSLKTLIGAETSARTKGDEDLGAKIKAEQTRAEGKEKEISDKLAIVDGDSNTEGSFRKAIADVIAAAPEDLDTLKEIADKLADNDDLHTALNQAITDKADASALLNEVARATGAESALQAAIDTKADATALSNYVLTAALNKQVDTLNTAISAKQDAGNYIPYNPKDADLYQINKGLAVTTTNGSATFDTDMYININANDSRVSINPSSLYCTNGQSSIDITTRGIVFMSDGNMLRLGGNGIVLPGGDFDHVLTSNGSTINMANYLKESDVSGQFAAKADRSDLIALEKKITANTTAIAGKQDIGNYVTYDTEYSGADLYAINRAISLVQRLTIGDAISGNANENVDISSQSITISSASMTGDVQLGQTGLLIEHNEGHITYTFDGITSSEHSNCLATSDGSFKPISDFVLKEEADEEYVTQDQLDGIRAGLAKKQDKIKVNSVDVQNLDRANIDQLIAIVKELLIALNSSGLIIMEDGFE